MDLILFAPGNAAAVFGSEENDRETGGSLIDNTWRNLDISQELGQCMELVSIQQGMKQQINTDAAHSSRASDRPIITELTCVKYVDKTSVRLYDMCLQAQPLGAGAQHPTKLYILRNSGDKTTNLMSIWLRDAIISDIQLQTNQNDMPTEQFKLKFTEILWRYTVQGTDTGILGQQVAGWSLMHNRPITAFTA